MRHLQENALGRFRTRKVLRVGERAEPSFLLRGRRTASLPFLLSLYGKGVSEAMKVDRNGRVVGGNLRAREVAAEIAAPPPPSMPAREVA